MWHIKGLNAISYESYAKISGVSDIGTRCSDYMYNSKETFLTKTRSVLILSTALLDTIYS